MNWLLENWKLKLISLVIALITWYYVRDINLNTVNISVPVTYENKPDNLYWEADPPRFVELSLRGRQEDLKFPTGNLKAQVNLAEATEGRKNYSIHFDPEQIPNKIEIVSFPSSVKVQLEKAVRKKLQVVVRVDGEPEQGYSLGNITITPKTVLVEGPQSRLNSVDTIYTEQIDLSGANKTIHIKKSLSVPRWMNPVDSVIADIRIAINGEGPKPDKIISGIKVEVENLDPALRVLLSDTHIKIHISGDPKVIQSLTAASFQAYVNLDGTRYNPNTGNILPFDTESEIEIHIRIFHSDESIKIVEVIPDNLTVRFFVKEEFQKTLNEGKETTEGPKEETK